MNCDCLEKVKKKVEEKFRAEAPPLDQDWVDLRWPGGRFALGSQVGVILTVPIEIRYRRLKVSGEPYSKITREEIDIKGSFCPFCGQKTEEIT